MDNIKYHFSNELQVVKKNQAEILKLKNAIENHNRNDQSEEQILVLENKIMQCIS